MPPTFDLAPAQDSVDEPDLEAHECHCQPADDRYLLTIEEGVAVIVHRACGKQPPSTRGDWQDLVVMDQPLPVTAKWVPECDGSEWHGDHRCDCGATVQLTAASAPKNAATAPLELSRKHAAMALLLIAPHAPARYNEYGSVVAPGFRADEGPDGKVRVDHRMPEADLSDPNRPSSDDMAAERNRQVDAYATTLAAAGWTVERGRPYDRRPWLLARPAEQKGGVL
jgi:hypothetical protein